MRLLLLANNWVGWQVVHWIKERGEDIVALVIHPPPKRRYGEEIVRSAGLPEGCIYDGSRLSDQGVIRAIERLQPELAISIFFGYLLRADFLSLFPQGVINLHPSYLPYNRGAHPNVWSIVENTPAGVTLHFMDSGVDTGEIIMQRQVAVEPVDTGETLYRKLEQASVEVFREAWSLVRTGQANRIAQQSGIGAHHYTRDLQKIDEIHLDQSYPARDLINIMRARTFPPYTGAYFWHEGRKVYLRLQLFYGDD